MLEYHKIQTIFKRDAKTNKVIVDEYSLPEFEYLKNNNWTFTEKVDGTNCRIFWNHEDKKIMFGGRTDAAKLPSILLNRLQEIFTVEKMVEFFTNTSVMFFGEGYGNKIQEPCGSLYNPNGVDFILFDVKIGKWWLEREAINKISANLKIKSVPIIGAGTLIDAVNFIQQCVGFESFLGRLQAEGLVLRPKTELLTRGGYRIIAKLKCKDFN